MVIRFTCPQGHKLSCPQDRAGKTGKCPHCDTLFQVPQPPEDKKEVPQAEEIIEFYCPNEHYLQSPARLQGKRGQCPHCGETFRVPVLDDDGEEDESVARHSDSGELEDLEELEEVQDRIDDIEEIEDIDDIEEVDEIDEGSGALSGGSSLGGSSLSGSGSGSRGLDFSFVDQGAGEPPGPLPPPPGPLVEEHALSALFERVWEESDQQAVIELELKSGEKIAPLNYAHDASRGQHGVFATKAPDGTHTLLVIAWEDIARITARGLRELPPTMFE